MALSTVLHGAAQRPRTSTFDLQGEDQFLPWCLNCWIQLCLKSTNFHVTKDFPGTSSYVTTDFGGICPLTCKTLCNWRSTVWLIWGLWAPGSRTGSRRGGASVLQERPTVWAVEVGGGAGTAWGPADDCPGWDHLCGRCFPMSFESQDSLQEPMEGP